MKAQEIKKYQFLEGYSKLSKEDQIKAIEAYSINARLADEFDSFRHTDPELQKRVEEFSENTVSNFHFPYSIAPNFLINNELYHIPMVIEESSVVAAASKSAKFWAQFGGFQSTVLSTTKIGQVHFIWHGKTELLQEHFAELQEILIEGTNHITENMRKRGGGIQSVSLVDMTGEMTGYYQLKAEFETADSMGANFINSCLEEFSTILKVWISNSGHFYNSDKNVEIIMAILSNYTPDCIVETNVSAPLKAFENIDDELNAHAFVDKFSKAVEIARIDPHRAATHNKGIFNGIDAVALATGNDFRAIEACGHTYASRNGSYTSLTKLEVQNDIFTYTLKIPIALGTVGGLTNLHPLAMRSLELLRQPNAEKLMQIASAVGLANNFSAVKSLITKGIQVGHMKMHLLNILNTFHASSDEKAAAEKHFMQEKVSYNAVRKFIENSRIKKYNGNPN